MKIRKFTNFLVTSKEFNKFTVSRNIGLFFLSSNELYTIQAWKERSVHGVKIQLDYGN